MATLKRANKMGDCQCTEGVKDGGQKEEEEEMFSVRHSFLLRLQGRLNSCPLSWIHLFDTGTRDRRKISLRKGTEKSTNLTPVLQHGV